MMMTMEDDEDDEDDDEDLILFLLRRLLNPAQCKVNIIAQDFEAKSVSQTLQQLQLLQLFQQSDSNKNPQQDAAKAFNVKLL